VAPLQAQENSNSLPPNKLRKTASGGFAEIRWDWSDTESPVLGVGGPFSFFAEDDQFTAAFDVIVAF